jgi:hypothetical protein
MKENTEIKKYINKTSLNHFDGLSLLSYDKFLADCHYDRIQKILSKYELFKMTQNVPGDIVECGVHKGSGIYLYAQLLKIFKPHSLSKIVGFDFFGEKQIIKNKFKVDYDCNKFHKPNGSNKNTIIKKLKKLDIKNVKLIPGDVCKTTKKYVEKNIGFRISLLILDVDNYEGTLSCLKNLYPYVSKGGVIIFDEYALETYGESDAVDEFLKDKKIEIKTNPWFATPSAYAIKN